MPPGRNLYPKGLTREQIEDYVKKHPEQKDAIYDPYTVIRRDGERLKTIPYDVEYKQWLEPARATASRGGGRERRQGIRQLPSPSRRCAADGNDYYPSDLAWVDLVNPKIDAIFAPYETYLDDVLA